MSSGDRNPVKNKAKIKLLFSHLRLSSSVSGVWWRIVVAKVTA